VRYARGAPKRTNRVAQKTPIFGPPRRDGGWYNVFETESQHLEKRKELLGAWEAVAAATKQYILLGAEGDEDHQQPAHQFVLLGAEGDEGGGSSDSGGVLKCSENPNLVSELLELRWWRWSVL
jgi:hypothetical protein